MFKSLKTTLLAGIVSASVLPAALAAPVTGYGADAQFSALYNAVLSVCQLAPPSRPPELTTTVTAYSGAVLEASVPLEVATQSFQELRDEYDALCGTPEADVIFDQLLPGTQAIGLGGEGDAPGTPS